MTWSVDRLSDRTAPGLYMWGRSPGERESHVARVEAESGSGTKSLSVPTPYRLSDENSRGKVRNVCRDSSVVYYNQGRQHSSLGQAFQNSVRSRDGNQELTA